MSGYTRNSGQRTRHTTTDALPLDTTPRVDFLTGQPSWRVDLDRELFELEDREREMERWPADAWGWG